MAVPTEPKWAETFQTTIPVPDGSVVLNTPNRTPIDLELQTYGLGYKVPVMAQHLNQQFWLINQNLNYLKSKETPIITVTTSDTFSLTHTGYVLRSTSATAINLTLRAVGSPSYVNFPVGTTFEIRQAAAGVVTVVAGDGTITLNIKSGFAAKTAGQHTTIFIRKATSGVGVESWDVWGDLGT